MKEKAFETIVDKIDYRDGFKMTFANGFTISVVFGKYTFSDGGETTAEVAAWDSQDNWLMFDGEKWFETEEYSDVMARQTAGEVAKLIYTLSQW